MSPQTGSGWGNSKNMCLSSRRVWAGFDVWIFTFSWYTTNWGSAEKCRRCTTGSKIVRKHKKSEWQEEQGVNQESKTGYQCYYLSLKQTAHPTHNWIRAKNWQNIILKLRRRKGKQQNTKSNTQRDPEPETQDPILTDSHGLVLDQGNKEEL